MDCVLIVPVNTAFVTWTMTESLDVHVPLANRIRSHSAVQKWMNLYVRHVYNYAQPKKHMGHHSSTHSHTSRKQIHTLLRVCSHLPSILKMGLWWYKYGYGSWCPRIKDLCPLIFFLKKGNCFARSMNRSQRLVHASCWWKIATHLPKALFTRNVCVCVCVNTLTLC